MSKKGNRICIGMPVYSHVSPEVLEDYMRFAYSVGRRLPEYEFFLAIKSKSEQFRARNGIVEAAIQLDCDYLLMMDDDHVIDWERKQGPNDRYLFPGKFVEHLKADPKLKVVGGLYYHRGGQCAPVILSEKPDGGYYYVNDTEIKNGLQEVAVTGGGCIMIEMDLFNIIPSPWFQIENKYGTDIQICQLARDYGFKVACDTSVVLGHILTKRDVVTPENRFSIMVKSAPDITTPRQQIENEWATHSALQLYRNDAMEYARFKDLEEVIDLATEYNKMTKEISEYKDLEVYYKTRGRMQLARQLYYHFTPNQVDGFDGLSKLIDIGKEGYGLDFGCGSAPIGFDYAMRGQKIDFVDIPGTYAYEFVKWRAKHRNIENRCGWELKGPYDYIFMMDSIEHLHPDKWRIMLGDIFSRLRDRGVLITNYFNNNDFENNEHINMNHEEVKQFIVENNIYPMNLIVWIKREWGLPEGKRHERNT